MNKIIEKELRKTMVADLSHFDGDSYFIPRYRSAKLDVNKCYIIELDDFLLDPSKSAMLASNFNNNSHPTERHMKVEVCKTMGNMIYVDGIGFDLDGDRDLPTFWSGWLTVDNLKVIREIV